jgi:hypothetical protein
MGMSDMDAPEKKRANRHPVETVIFTLDRRHVKQKNRPLESPENPTSSRT